MRQHRVVYAVTLATAFLAVSDLAAQVARRSQQDLATSLKARGWKERSPGVYEKRSSGTVETMAFGSAGRTRTLAELGAQYKSLLKRHERNPSEALTKSLGTLRRTLAQLKSTAARPTSPDETVPSEACYPHITTDPRAYPTEWGAAATALTAFRNNCGYNATVGAFAQAWTDTETNYESDYQYGPNVTAFAEASIEGYPCGSYAESLVFVHEIGVLHQVSVHNGACAWGRQDDEGRGGHEQP